MGQYIFSLFLSACLLSTFSCSLEPQQQSPGALLAPEFPAASFSDTSASGFVLAPSTVEPVQVLPLAAPAHGWVRQVFFEDGEYVRKRQILLKYMHNKVYSSEFSRTYLLAPQAGFLVKKNVAVGRHLVAGSRVATLQDVSQVKLRLVVAPQVGRHLQACALVPVRIAELPSRSFTGVIEQVVPQALPQDSLLITVLVRNNVTPLIRPLMHAQLLLPTQPTPAATARR